MEQPPRSNNNSKTTLYFLSGPEEFVIENNFSTSTYRVTSHEIIF